MKINWQIITFAVMLIAVSCSKEKQTMNNGLVIEDIKIGDGQEVEKFNIVTVNYTGLLENGTKFDSSLDRGEPIQFPLGQGRVIKGWDEGISLLKYYRATIQCL